MNILTLENCSIPFGSDMGSLLLSDVSFEIKQNERIAIVGPNGAGKSTLLSVIAGHTPSIDGKVEIKRKLKIGYMFQNYREMLLPWKNVYENLKLPYVLKHKQIDHDYIEHIMKDLHLVKLKDSKAFSLSGGEQQRVALAQIFCHNPELLLLDEPLSAIDYAMRHNILDLIINHVNKKSITAVMVTHQIDEAKKFSNKIIMVSDSKVVVKKNVNHIFQGDS